MKGCVGYTVTKKKQNQRKKFRQTNRDKEIAVMSVQVFPSESLRIPFFCFMTPRHWINGFRQFF